MPIGNFHYLHCMVLNEAMSEEGRLKKQKEMAGDAMEETFT